MTHADTIMELQRSLHNDEASADVWLSSDKGIVFRAHRFLLCFCSDYFKEMFRDVPTNQEVTIIIPEVRPSILKTILDFIYTGEVCVSSEDMSDFFNAFNLLEIKSGINCERRVTQKQEQTQYREELTIEPVEDIEIEVQQQSGSVDKSEENDGMHSEKDLEYLEVYSSHEKFAQYTIEQPSSDYILTEGAESSFVLPVEKTENEITINADEVHAVENSDLEPKFKIQKTPKIFKPDEIQGIGSRGEAFEAAVQEVLQLGVSLQKAATKYNISKTVLWRRVRKNSAYKTEREHPMLNAAISMLESGESLKTISQAIKIPISTLHRHKVRLLQEGRLPQHIQVRRRDSKDNLKERISNAINACARGMSQNQAANVYSVPKSTLWRHLQRQSTCNVKIDSQLSDEISIPS